MARCQSDDCDLVHCSRCSCHTVGNTLAPNGECQDCNALTNEMQDELYRRQYLLKIPAIKRFFRLAANKTVWLATE